MRNSAFLLLILFLLTLLTGCVTTKGIEEALVIEKIVPEIEPEEPPREVRIDYQQLELELLGIYQVEEKPGLFNSYNPQFASDEKYLAFEVNLGNYKKIYIYSIDVEMIENKQEFQYNRVKEVYLDEAFRGELSEDFFESFINESFNYEFSWFPASTSFIFTSNAGLGEYNLFIGSVEEDDAVLTSISKNLNPKQFGNYFMMTEEIKKDGQAKVSPDGKRIVFTSARTGNGDLYLLDLSLGLLKRLTLSDETDFFPRWSPDGMDIVYTTGGKYSHDIHVVRNVGSGNETDEVLVKWFFDDVLPTYSPDGRYISFYTTYNRERDPFNTKRWGIMIIPSDGSAPSAGKDLIQYFHVSDIIKDNTQGTAWFPDSKHIIFAKNIDSDYNPIYIYHVEERREKFVNTETDINHDLTVSPHGLVSFRAQLFGWDRVFVASTTYFQEYLKGFYNN